MWVKGHVQGDGHYKTTISAAEFERFIVIMFKAVFMFLAITSVTA